MVFSGRRARYRDSVLPRAPASDETRTQADAGDRRRHRHRVYAHPAPRSRPRARYRVSTSLQTPAPGTFGSFAQPYPDFYKPKPKSRKYVLHLPAWYAQAHPAEDFAETFAVWLTPRSQWRRRYRGWPALRKLEYIDELMNDLAGTKPRNRTRTKVEPLSALKITLREHYRRKRERYDFEWPAVYDRDLHRIFSDDPRHKSK